MAEPNFHSTQLEAHPYLVSCNHWWKALACCANSCRNLSFSSCLLCSFCSSSSRSCAQQKKKEKKKGTCMINWRHAWQMFLNDQRPLHRPWWSSAGSSRSPPGPPWWTRCRGSTPPGSSWSAGPALPAGWSRPELSSVMSGKPRGLHAAPGSPPESYT